jgi:hypothetical protein
VDGNGLVTAVGRGSVTITARVEGVAGTIQFDVNPVISSATDGIPDDWKIAHGFDPNDTSVANADTDEDGLANLQEFQLGTDPRNPDTDGDGVTDGQEVKRPRLAGGEGGIRTPNRGVSPYDSLANVSPPSALIRNQ